VAEEDITGVAVDTSWEEIEDDSHSLHPPKKRLLEMSIDAFSKNVNRRILKKFVEVVLSISILSKQNTRHVFYTSYSSPSKLLTFP